MKNSLPKCTYISYNRDGNISSNAAGEEDNDGGGDTRTENFDFAAPEALLIKSSILRDDKLAELVTHVRRSSEGSSDEQLRRSTVWKILHLCFDVDAAALLDGELGTTALVNWLNETGKSALHTGQRIRDGSAQLALDLSLPSAR